MPVTRDRSDAKPRLVILTRDGLEHRYVANRLGAAVPIEAIVVDTATRTPSLRRAFRSGVQRGMGRIALHVFRKAVRDEAAATAALRRVLGARQTLEFADPDLVVRVDGVNSAEALAAVRRAAPDVLLVYGTTMVGQDMLGLARNLSLNLHTGMSPNYRGTDCVLWPLVNGEPERIGATVHECTASPDAGPIFAVAATAGVVPGDGLHDLFARTVATGADLYVQVAERYLAGALERAPQDLSDGREYRGSMRTLGPELRARWALRRGILDRRPAGLSTGGVTEVGHRLRRSTTDG